MKWITGLLLLAAWQTGAQVSSIQGVAASHPVHKPGAFSIHRATPSHPVKEAWGLQPPEFSFHRLYGWAIPVVFETPAYRLRAAPRRGAAAGAGFFVPPMRAAGALFPTEGPHLPANPPAGLQWTAETLPFFCRIEHDLGKKTRVPFKFRLGSVEYVDWLEGKPGCSDFALYR